MQADLQLKPVIDESGNYVLTLTPAEYNTLWLEYNKSVQKRNEYNRYHREYRKRKQVSQSGEYGLLHVAKMAPVPTAQ